MLGDGQRAQRMIGKALREQVDPDAGYPSPKNTARALVTASSSPITPLSFVLRTVWGRSTAICEGKRKPFRSFGATSIRSPEFRA
jgi:hypothetical protein